MTRLFASSLLVPVLLSLSLSAIAAPVSDDHAERMKEGTALFTKTIRPALTEHCLKCHGGEKIRADFNLANRESLLQGGESGAAIVPGKPGESFLMDLLRHEEEPEMPSKKPKLPDALIAGFERWIELGAPYDKPLIEGALKQGPMQVTESDRQFWSFLPLKNVEAPEPVHGAGTAIDRFVFAKLDEAGLAPNPPAGRRLAARRAFLDLIGLPPTPEQLDAFLADESNEAWPRLIDQLLDSPHYGERWARHWLDAARFAESHGFEQDYDRPHAYHYRDFVIKALNSDMPYNQFVRWQLAGDEAAPDDPLALMATGFLGAGVFPTQLTEKEFESARYDELDDMLSTTGTAFLGLTIGCARCHDHKFDPFPAADYYRLLSTFTTTIRSEIDVEMDPATFAREKAAWEKKHRELAGARALYEKGAIQEQFAAWLENVPDEDQPTGPWKVLELESTQSKGGATFTKLPDGSVLAGGKNAGDDRYTLKAETQVGGIRAIRLEGLTHESLPQKGPGRAANGNFGLSHIKVLARPIGNGKKKPVEVKLVSAKATHEQNAGTLSVNASLDAKNRKAGWAVDKGGIGKDQAAVFAFEKSIGFEEGTALEIILDFGVNGQHNIGRPRLSISNGEAPVETGSGVPQLLSESFAILAAGHPEKLGKPQRDALFRWFAAKSDPKWKKLDDAVFAHRSAEPQPKLTKLQVSSEGFPPTKHHADGRGFPHFYPETHFLKRGDPNQKEGVAPQDFLQVLMRNNTQSSTWKATPPSEARTSHRRSALANWMTDTENGAGHLLARVIVNRLWHHHFGQGIVSTPNDFGFQGEMPTHPELLDYLAKRLIASGWKLKPIHREIILSAAYRQSSEPSPEKAAADPGNRWLWRFPPRRLEAEVVRDSMLSVSGVLDPTMFGKGTLSESHKRRSIYFMIKRSRLVPMMQIFDQPEPLVSQGDRPRTTIAPQALLFMNNPQVISWAQALAGRIDPGSADFDAAIRDGVEIVLNREPTGAELAENRSFLEEQTASYDSGNPEQARRLALSDFCQVLFSLNEFVYLP